MYRAFALSAERASARDPEAIKAQLEQLDLSFDSRGCICLRGEDVSRFVGAPDIALRASELSTLPEVREKLVSMQKAMGEDGGIVLEGRDIGTVVFPDAELKIFLVADPNIRAERRLEELEASGTHMTLEELRQQVLERDKRDRERTLSPLTKAPDAIEVDTTYLTIDEQVERVVQLAKARMLVQSMP